MAKESNQTAVMDVVNPFAATTDPWQIGLQAKQSGSTAPAAIQQVYMGMPFPANLTFVAQIIGALYADIYFGPTQMNAQKLANDLNGALGKNPADCLKAAQAAFKQWYGLSVRANFADNGSIPRQSSGTLTQSPDLLVNGTTPIPVTLMIQHWSQPTWGPVNGNQNLTYGRSASVNIGVPITQGAFSMFVTDAGLNNPPNQWTQLFTQSGGRTSPLQTISGATVLQPGDRGAIADPFLWDVPGSGHYCIIGAASSEFFANDPTKVQPSNWSSFTWINSNGAAGWHNLETVLKSDAVLKIYNLDGTNELYELEAHASNVPLGTEISLLADDPALPAIIRSNAARIASKEQVVRAAGYLPGNYKGDLQVRFKTPDGGLLPAPASVEVRMYWVIPPGHRHYEDAVAALGDTTAHALSRPARLLVGGFTFLGRQ